MRPRCQLCVESAYPFAAALDHLPSPARSNRQGQVTLNRARAPSEPSSRGPGEARPAVASYPPSKIPMTAARRPLHRQDPAQPDCGVRSLAVKLAGC